MIINQGEDDGHVWYCVTSGNVTFELHFDSPGLLYFVVNDEDQKWKGPYSGEGIKGQTAIEEFLNELEKFVEDVRNDLKHPYNS